METWSRRLVLAALGALLVGSCLVVSSPAQADSPTCHNADSTNRPPFNWTDRCYVASPDRGASYVSDLTGDDDCGQGTYNRQRIRVVVDFLGGSPAKLRIRSIDIRYLSGVQPWAYYQMTVYDGNDTGFFRDWNWYGNLIENDGASDTVENTVHIVPNSGFAPSFGGHGYVSIRIIPHFYATPDTSQLPQKCKGDPLAMRLVAP